MPRRTIPAEGRREPRVRPRSNGNSQEDHSPPHVEKTIAVLCVLLGASCALAYWMTDADKAAKAFEAHASRMESRGRVLQKDRPKKEINTNLLFPLVYAAVLPAIRLGLRGRLPQPTIDRIFAGGIAVGLGHAGYMMLSESST